jgi:predicted nuclease of predicted toxin-antitoxin system
MRFLANENFPGAAVTALEAAGHDVVWIRTAAPGAIDRDVLAWAAREERILLTFDKDFGELANGSDSAVHVWSRAVSHTDAKGGRGGATACRGDYRA